MPYIPKPTAPTSFNAVDAIISAVHNDPVWGWLEGYAHLYPNQYVSTAWFCEQGPTGAGALTLGDLLNLAAVGSPEFFAGEQRIAQKIIGALHDRLVGAMCLQQQAGTNPTGFDTPRCFTVSHTGGTQGSAGGWFAIPAGATQIRIEITTQFSGSGSISVNQADPGPSNGTVIQSYNSGNGVGASVFALRSGATFWNIYYNGDTAGVVCVAFNVGGPYDPTPYDPTPQPQPSGFTPRAVPPTAAVADLAPILFALELKLEQLLPIAAGVLTNQLDTGLVAADAIDAPTNSPINAVGWLGFIVTLSGVPVQADVSFGTPQRYSKLARVNVGTEEGWYPPIEVNVSPMVVRPMPPGGDRVAVTVDPPATATVTPILKSSI